MIGKVLKSNLEDYGKKLFTIEPEIQNCKVTILRNCFETRIRNEREAKKSKIEDRISTLYDIVRIYFDN
jgi:hypothetical protein